MLIRANEAADKAATDLLNTYNTYKHVQKFGDMLDKDGVGSATTTTAGDQGRRSHYIPVDSAGSENQYRLTSKLDGRYALETKKPGGDWRITRGDEAARNAERSAVKALNKLGKSPKRSQLKKVANAMHEVSKAYERKT
ncbi:hypothetical protein FRB96_007984 [Tulasnella sp. 330]|nr:hypothetical protein FRB96_007984 [Tulasnella sp. 330]KAG8889227.1 hypothetical protein FRB98_005239 [Tulasnella sp. 332]